MKFIFVKKAEGKVASYNGKKVKTGDTVELSGHFAKKAEANPDYERVATPEVKADVKPETKIKATPEVKADGDATAAKK